VANLLIAVAGLTLVAYLLYRLMRWARGRTAGAYMLGAVLTEVTQGTVVREAKQGRGDAGDPPL
jgi:hypothetical protein